MKHQKENSTSAEVVFSNEDLLLLILLRVPAKPLIRFKCVSKYLLGLISDRQFGYNHATRNREPISALYCHFGSSKYDKLKCVSLHGDGILPTLSFLRGIEMSWTIEVIHTCNGLMLCSCQSQKKYSYIVCNLTTQKYVTVSQPTARKGFINRSSLAFDPAVSPYYRIVAFGCLCSGTHPIDIYSSENSSWTQVHAPEVVYLPMNLNLKSFYNGSLHWMSSNYYFQFEVETQKLTKIRTSILAGYEINFLGECGGNLLLVQFASANADRLRVHEMERETGSWILKESVSLGSIHEAFPNGRIRFNLLTIFKGSNEGKEMTLVLQIAGGNKIIAFYPNLEKFEVICDTPDCSPLVHFQNGGAYHHFGSLCPV